jgi:hypothetical protein
MSDHGQILHAEGAAEEYLALAEKAMEQGKFEKASGYAAIALVHQRRAEHFAADLRRRVG